MGPAARNRAVPPALQGCWFCKCISARQRARCPPAPAPTPRAAKAPRPCSRGAGGLPGSPQTAPSPSCECQAPNSLPYAPVPSNKRAQESGLVGIKGEKKKEKRFPSFVTACCQAGFQLSSFLCSTASSPFFSRNFPSFETLAPVLCSGDVCCTSRHGSFP